MGNVIKIRKIDIAKLVKIGNLVQNEITLTILSYVQ